MTGDNKKQAPAVHGFTIQRKTARSNKERRPQFEIPASLYEFQIKYGDVPGTEELGSIAWIFQVSVEIAAPKTPIDYYLAAAKELETFVRTEFKDSAGVKNAKMDAHEQWPEQQADTDQKRIVTLVVEVTGHAFKYNRL